MKLITILVVILFFSVIQADSQIVDKKLTGYMGGQIFDNDETTPIEGAKLILTHIPKGFTFSDLSSKNGSYLINDLPPGLYNVSIQYLNREHKYTGQILAEAKEKFYIKACWATKHEKTLAKLLERDCESRMPLAWWKQKKILIIGGGAAAAAAAALTLREEPEASPSKP